MNINTLFDSLDEKVFTADLKNSLQESFNAAVDAKAEELSTELAEAKIVELEEAAEAFKETLLAEAAEKEEALLEAVDTFLEKTVDDFVNESKEALKAELVHEKADLMVEAFDAMLLSAGMDVAKIVEAKDESSVETKLAESTAKYDKLIEENIVLEKENANLIKLGMINEMKEGLSIVEAERFSKIAETVTFSKDDAYAAKLETIKESLKTSASEEVKKELNEDVKTKSSYAHLI